MAEQADQVCAICAKPIDIPRQNFATTDDTLCSTCARLMRRSRLKDDRADREFGIQLFDRVDHDIHASGM